MVVYMEKHVGYNHNQEQIVCYVLTSVNLFLITNAYHHMSKLGVCLFQKTITHEVRSQIVFPVELPVSNPIPGCVRLI